MDENLIKQFVEKFFISLNASILTKENSLFITNVSESFEKFYGKKSPYNFIFNKLYKNSENELIESGSYLLKIISNFLETQGKTTLLKINFEERIEKEFLNYIKLRNCEIAKLIKKKRHKFFFRFTFHTTFQYLNEKEKKINEIYIYQGKIVKGDLKSYKITEGDKNEVIIPEIDKPYFLAKEKLRNLIQPELKSLSEKLSKKLDKEIKRIENHLIKEKLEFEKKLTKNIDKEILFNKNIEFEKDKKRLIKFEKQKYCLDIKTKLFNTTLIYYPLFTYDCFLTNNSSKRIIELSFDPLLKKFNLLFCESCNKNIKEIFLCSSGHISCKGCFLKCPSCKKDYCKKCLKIVCAICKKNICKNCGVRCFNCGKIVCKSHTIQDKISKRFYCKDCLKICERCGKQKKSDGFKKSKRTGAEICEECFREEMQKNAIERIFPKN
jgi:hypothetical protein